MEEKIVFDENFWPDLGHLRARGGKLGRVLRIWDGPDENELGLVLRRTGPCLMVSSARPGFRQSHKNL